MELIHFVDGKLIPPCEIGSEPSAGMNTFIEFAESIGLIQAQSIFGH
jgi:hypothetical protein